MFLRRWNPTTSNPLARKPVPPVAKLAQPRYDFPLIYSRAFTSSHNGLTESPQANRVDDSLRLKITRVPNRLAQKVPLTYASGPPSHESTNPEADQIEDELSSLDSGGWESLFRRVQAEENIHTNNSNNGSFKGGAPQDPSSSSEEGQYQELRGWFGEEEGLGESLDSLPGRAYPFILNSAPLQSWDPAEQVQATLGSVLSIPGLESIENADWAHLIPSRPLHSNLHERFQLPLNTQQVWKLQEMANYEKSRSILTDEFGEKSEFSHDWMRALEILQYEAQLEDSAHNVPHDQASVTYYYLGQGSETPASASEIKIPTQWTPLSFAAFVTRVTRLRPLSWDKRRDQRHRPLSIESIDACLLALFNDPNMREYFTIDAFNSALAFFYTHKYHSIHRARELYNLMELLQMDNDPRTFVIMLAAAAKQKDLALLNRILTVMVRKGVKPTRTVWLKLLETVQAKSIRTHIIKIMRTQGLLEDIAMVRSIVGLTLPPELPNHVQSGQDLQSFYDFVDAKYGIEWPTTTIGNRMTQELCRVGLFSDALQVWHILQARGCLPDAHTLDIILGHSKKLFDVGTSIEIVRHFWRLYGIQPGALAHDLLFRHAWAMRSYNCCKTVWQHACMEGHSHSKMDSMLLFSLTRWDVHEPSFVLRSGFKSTVEKFLNPSDAWFRCAGKVVLENDRVIFRSTVEALRGPSKIEESLHLSLLWEDTWERDVALQSLRNKEESLAGMQSHDEFVDLLIAAYELDRVWHGRDFWEQPTEWKVTNAIVIPMASSQAPSPLEETSIPFEGKDHEETLQRVEKPKQKIVLSLEARSRLVPVKLGDENIMSDRKTGRRQPRRKVRPDSAIKILPPIAAVDPSKQIAHPYIRRRRSHVLTTRSLMKAPRESLPFVKEQDGSKRNGWPRFITTSRPTNKAQLKATFIRKIQYKDGERSKAMIRRCSSVPRNIQENQALAAMRPAEWVRRPPSLTLNKYPSARMVVIRPKEVPLKAARRIARIRRILQQRRVLDKREEGRTL